MQCQEFFNKKIEHHQLMSILIYFLAIFFYVPQLTPLKIKPNLVIKNMKIKEI